MNSLAQAAFLTAMPHFQYTGKKGNYYLKDNLLYQDGDESIYIIPRWFITDFYTIPDWLAWLAGDSAERDPSPAVVHDFGCDYHALIKVNLSYEQLCTMGFVRAHLCKETDKYITVCEDIPTEHLQLIPVSKGEINDVLGRAMCAAGTIGAWGKGVIRTGVAFNIGWLFSKKEFDFNTIYRYKEI